MDKKKLIKLIEDDELDLLKVKAPTREYNAEDRLLGAFQEINNFYRKNGREPSANDKDMGEFKLHSRLMSLRADQAKSAQLKDHDEFGLLAKAKPLSSINDIFEDDEMGLLAKDKDSIFSLKHVPKEQKTPDYIATRKKCRDFEKFESLFKECQADLKAKKRRLLPFAKEKQISVGLFFILKGLLLYVAEVIEEGERSPRLRVIFENGTESDMLRHSLGARLYTDGRRVSAHEDRLLDAFAGVTDDDKETGFVYVLRSKSTDSKVTGTKDLFKVGFSRQPVEERIRNAHQDPIFLMAPVAIIATYRCFNLNPQKLEGILHKFFGSACLNIKIFDSNGHECAPREWFIAPLDVIEQAIFLLLSGEIVDFKYDPNLREIVSV